MEELNEIFEFGHNGPNLVENLAAMVISNEKGGAGWDLYLAARDGQVDLVTQLATREQPADRCVVQRRPFVHFCVVDMVKVLMLLYRSKLLNASYTEGEQSCTPLIIASRNGHTGVVSALLDLCCQVEAEGTVKVSCRLTRCF